MDGESPGGLNPTQRTAGYYGTARAGETVLPMKNTLFGYPVPNGQLGKHANDVLDSADCIHVLKEDTCIYTYAYNKKKRCPWI